MNIKLLIIAFFCAFALFTCDNELNVTADFRTIPVVYALIDGNEPVNYVRVEKGFIDPVISGVEIAQNPDSLYFGPEVTVRIVNLRTNNSVNLERVNLEDEGFTREEGTFATQPNIGYKLTTADLGLEVNDPIRLELIRDESVLTSGEASIIGEYTIPTTNPANPVRFREDQDVSFGIRSTEQAANFYEFRIFVNFTEENTANNTTEIKQIEWVVETGRERARTSANGDFQPVTIFRFEGQEFFRFLGNNIEENPNVRRTFNFFDVRYDAAGESLLEFINIGLANTGITSNQTIPRFTNLTGDAVGVVSSRTTIRNVEPFILNTEARDSLRSGRFTEELNFN